MTDAPTRSSTSYSVELMGDAKRTLGLSEVDTLDSLLKKVIAGGTVEMDREQWWAYGRKFYADERA